MTTTSDAAAADDGDVDDAEKTHRGGGGGGGASAGVPTRASADDDDDDDIMDGSHPGWRKYGEKVCFKNKADKVCERRSYYKCTMCAGCPARKRVSVDARGRRRAWLQGEHRHDVEDVDSLREKPKQPNAVVPVKKRKVASTASAKHHHCPALDVSVPVKKRKVIASPSGATRQHRRRQQRSHHLEGAAVTFLTRDRAAKESIGALPSSSSGPIVKPSSTSVDITTRVTLLNVANPLDAALERRIPGELAGVKFFAHLQGGPGDDASHSDAAADNGLSAHQKTMLRPVRVLAMTPANAAHLKRLLARSTTTTTTTTRAQSNWSSPPPLRPPLGAPPPQQNTPPPPTSNTTSSGGNSVFVDYGVYKTKGALKVKCVKAQFERDAGGRSVLKRAGGILFELANATAPRQYDWGNKSSFMLSATEAAELADRMAANSGCSFFHDPGAGTSARGATNKKFVVEPMPDGSGGLFVNVSVTSKSSGNDGGAKSFHSVPVSYGESAAIRHLIVYLVPRLMGFDELFTANK